MQLLEPVSHFLPAGRFKDYSPHPHPIHPPFSRIISLWYRTVLKFLTLEDQYPRMVGCSLRRIFSNLNAWTEFIYLVEDYSRKISVKLLSKYLQWDRNKMAYFPLSYVNGIFKLPCPHGFWGDVLYLLFWLPCQLIQIQPLVYLVKDYPRNISLKLVKISAVCLWKLLVATAMKAHEECKQKHIFWVDCLQSIQSI